MLQFVTAVRERYRAAIEKQKSNEPVIANVKESKLNGTGEDRANWKTGISKNAGIVTTLSSEVPRGRSRIIVHTVLHSQPVTGAYTTKTATVSRAKIAESYSRPACVRMAPRWCEF